MPMPKTRKIVPMLLAIPGRTVIKADPANIQIIATNSKLSVFKYKGKVMNRSGIANQNSPIKLMKTAFMNPIKSPLAKYCPSRSVRAYKGKGRIFQPPVVLLPLTNSMKNSTMITVQIIMRGA